MILVFAHQDSLIWKWYKTFFILFKDKGSVFYRTQIDEKFRHLCFETSNQEKEYQSIFSANIPVDMRFIVRLCFVKKISRRKDVKGKLKSEGQWNVFLNIKTVNYSKSFTKRSFQKWYQEILCQHFCNISYAMHWCVFFCLGIGTP